MKRTLMKRSLAAFACLLLVTPAMAQTAQKEASSATAEFAKTVAISDLFEVEAGKLAQDKGNAGQKTFGATMVKDHSKTTSELKALVSSGKVKTQLPSALDDAHQGKLDKLKAATGKEFASAYKASQVDAHQDAVALFERYAKSGDNADLKAWAGKTLPALKHHADMAKKLGDS